MDGPLLAGADVGRWAAALADAALPLGLNRGRPVVFAADAEAIERAARTLRLDPADAEQQLVAACAERWKITSLRGIGGVSLDARAWRGRSAPRSAPPWLCLLAVSTLAASWMDSDDQGRATGYYRHLARLLQITEQPGSPPIPGFAATKTLWTELAVWLAEDEAGERGLLRLPDPDMPGYRGRPYVRLPVSQIIFRRRDRVILADFFAANRAGFDAGWNMRRLLFGRRHQLTAPAKEKIEDTAMAELVEGALRAAYAAWDGSSRDDAGRKLWPAGLRLAATHRRVTLNISQPELGVATLHADGGERVELPAVGDVAIPLGWLDRIAATGVALRVEGRDERVVIRRTETLLFEHDVGLVWVRAAADEPVWALSREPWAHNPALDERRVDHPDIPSGWTLLGDLEPAVLPEHLRAAARDDRPAVSLTGGLELADGVYLDGYPPRLLAGELAEPLDVTVNRHRARPLGSLQSLRLDISEGVSEISVEDVVRFRVEMTARGAREQVGSLTWQLAAPARARWGATPPADAAAGAQVSGAKLSGVEPSAVASPLLLRTRAIVFVIGHDGSVTGHGRPEPGGWMQTIGLSDGPTRWRVPGAEQAAFVLVTGRRPRVIMVTPGDVAITDEVADLAERHADCDCTDRNGHPSQTAERAWRALTMACEQAYERG